MFSYRNGELNYESYIKCITGPDMVSSPTTEVGRTVSYIVFGSRYIAYAMFCQRNDEINYESYMICTTGPDVVSSLATELGRTVISVLYIVFLS